MSGEPTFESCLYRISMTLLAVLLFAACTILSLAAWKWVLSWLL